MADAAAAAVEAAVDVIKLFFLRHRHHGQISSSFYPDLTLASTARSLLPYSDILSLSKLRIGPIS